MTTRHVHVRAQGGVLLAAALVLTGCGQRGPATTNTTSTTIKTLAARVEFLERYVNFRRTYETLDFDIRYANNSDGLLPAPSDWDIRVVATVPEAELKAWELTPALPAPPDKDWLKAVPTSLDLAGVDEWFGDARRVVGIDRKRRIVVYRACTN